MLQLIASVNRIVSVSAHLLLSPFSVNKWSCRREPAILPNSFIRCSPEPDLCPPPLFGPQWSMSNHKGFTAIHHQLTNSRSCIACQALKPPCWHRVWKPGKYKYFCSLHFTHKIYIPELWPGYRQGKCACVRERNVRKLQLKRRFSGTGRWQNTKLFWNSSRRQV